MATNLNDALKEQGRLYTEQLKNDPSLSYNQWLANLYKSERERLNQANTNYYNINNQYASTRKNALTTGDMTEYNKLKNAYTSFDSPIYELTKQSKYNSNLFTDTSGSMTTSTYNPFKRFARY